MFVLKNISKVSTCNQVLVIMKLKMLTGINMGVKERTKKSKGCRQHWGF